ncbi:MAG TPA: sigma-70 family RNA polymerase sigma factor [Terriglobia bacterium]|nr:sigma-70 family RNA polymerase sigma factor [Terriglobia bacterium]
MARNGGKNPHGEKLFGYNRRDFFEMTRSASTDVTKLLLAWSKGNARALDELIPVVHRELRAIARRQMAGERPDHTLQATALVNEAYLRLVDLRQMQWQNRAHFFGAAAQVMRRVLVDFARKRNYLKRGGGQHAITLIEDKLPIADGKMDLVALDDALTALAELDERKARVVELRFFGGLTAEETAEVLKISTDTVLRDWRFSKVWLKAELKKSAGGRT